jgi:hypothetical protein
VQDASFETGLYTGGAINIQFENDIFSGTDRHYTNGVMLSYLSAPNKVPDVMRAAAREIPLIDSNGQLHYSLRLGQSMFTPKDITIESLQPEDRPYAGWTYAALGLVSEKDNTLDELELTLGIIGPSSLAEDTQDYVHVLRNNDRPKGWDHQLSNELGVNVAYSRSWRQTNPYLLFGVLESELIPHAGFSVGNVFTHGAAGATLRIGQGLDQDFGAARIRPSLPGSLFFRGSRDFAWSAFIGAEGRVVGRNIFLDGNTFQNSHSVDKKMVVGDIQAGISLLWRNTRITFTSVYRSKEFENQNEADRFGAISISFRL